MLRTFLVYVTFLVGGVVGSLATLELAAQTWNFASPISVVATTVNSLRAQAMILVAADGSYIASVSDGLPVAVQNGGATTPTRNSAIVEGPKEHGQSATDTWPLQQGYMAVAHGANPTAVAANAMTRGYANRAGVPFVLGGHPNVVTIEAQIQDADGALTDQALVTVSAGTKIVVTQAAAACDGSTATPTNIVVGFGAATLPARAHTGAVGILLAMDGVAAGGGPPVRGNGAGIIGIGADGEDVRYTIEDPGTGNCSILLSYFTIES